MAFDDLHPELQEAFQEAAEARSARREWSDEKRKYVREELTKRAATPGSISGVAPAVVGGLFDMLVPPEMFQPGKTPVEDVMPGLSMMPGFTGASFAESIATKLANRGLRLNPEGAKRLKTLAEEVDRSFVDTLIKPIEGPDIHDLFQLDWRFRPKQMEMGSQGEVIYNPPRMFFPPERTKHGLESGTLEGYLSTKGGALHEVGHEAEDRIPDLAWREAWGIPKKQELYNYDFPVESSITDRAVADLEDIWRYSEDTGLFLPSYLRKDYQNPRWNYWLYNMNVPNRRLLSEAAADRNMLIGFGAEPGAIFKNLLVDPSIMNDQYTFRMGDIKNFADLYRRQSPITIKGKPYGFLLGR